jgi:hypothetical protein
MRSFRLPPSVRQYDTPFWEVAMKRVALNLAALAVILGGGSFLASPVRADTVQATCGGCSGLCCGYDENGRCWAADVNCPKDTEEVDQLN